MVGLGVVQIAGLMLWALSRRSSREEPEPDPWIPPGFEQQAGAETIKEPSADLRVPFAQSGAFVCKYIIGEPNDRAVCCGAPVSDGKSWCAYHRRIVFEPTRPGRIR